MFKVTIKLEFRRTGGIDHTKSNLCILKLVCMEIVLYDGNLISLLKESLEIKEVNNEKVKMVLKHKKIIQ